MFPFEGSFKLLILLGAFPGMAVGSSVGHVNVFTNFRLLWPKKLLLKSGVTPSPFTGADRQSLSARSPSGSTSITRVLRVALWATRARFCFLPALPGGRNTAKDSADPSGLADASLPTLSSSDMATATRFFARFARLRGVGEMAAA